MNDSLRDVYETDKEKYTEEEKNRVNEILSLLEKNELSDVDKRKYYSNLEKILIDLRPVLDDTFDFDRVSLNIKLSELLESLRKLIVSNNKSKDRTGSNPVSAAASSNDSDEKYEYFGETAGRRKTRKGVLVISSVALVAALLAGGYVIVKNLPKFTKGTGTKDKNSSGTVLDKIKGSIEYNSKNNVAIIDGTNKTNDLDNNTANTDTNTGTVNNNNTDSNIDSSTDTSGLVLVEETVEALTTENFEVLVSEYANKYHEEYDGIVSTNDIVKFAAIANIDVLCEDNRELANELFGIQTKEEYLGDAAKLIGATVMYNFRQWNNSLSTENFIRVSNLVYGEQKDKMLKIEDYTDKIAAAVKAEDGDLVNEIIDKFLTDMSSGSLSKLDDGVGFAAQVNIAVIADGIAKDYLNQENFDMFQILKTSEKYVSNIFTEYEQCTNNDVKTKIK